MGSEKRSSSVGAVRPPSGTTASVTALLVCPPAVTVTGPLTVPAGMSTSMLVGVTFTPDAVAFAKVTVFVEPGTNPEPRIVTKEPAAAVRGAMPEIAALGCAIVEKLDRNGEASG